MLEIKKATVGDDKIISLLGRITFDQAFGHLFRDQNDLMEYLDRTFSINKISSSLSKKENVFWIAYWDNLPVGYAKLKLNSLSKFISRENVCQLQKIYVLHDFLSKKIGTALQKTVLDEARLKSFEAIWLSVWEGNEKAINFYERNHFTKIGEHDFKIGKEKFRFQAMALELVKT